MMVDIELELTRTEAVIVTETVLLDIVLIEATGTRNDQVLLRGWSKQYHRPLHLAEVQEINSNLAHFFSLLLSWEQHFKQEGLILEGGESLDTHV